MSRFTAFLTVMVATRDLTLFEYGVVTLVLSVTGPVNSISGLGLDELILADTSRSLGEKRFGYAKKLLLSFFRVRIIIAAALIFFGWFLRGPLEARYGPAISHYFFLVFLLICAQFLKNAVNLIFQIHQKFGYLSFFGTAEVVVRFLAIILFWRLSSLTIATTLLSYVIATALPVILLLPAVIKTIPYFFTVRGESGGVIWQILRRHGKWQMALDISSSFISNIKYWLIKLFLSTEAVAVFSVAQSMYSAVASLLPMKSVMFPIIAEKSGEPAVMRALLARSTKYSLIVYSGLLFLSWFIAPPFIRVFFPKYVIGIFIFQLMALRLPLNAFSISQAPLLTILKEQKYIFLMALVNAASVMLLLPLFMSLFGLVGVVAEWLITVLLIIFLREIYLRRKYGISSIDVRSFFTIDHYDKVIVRRILHRFRVSKSV